jgi:hypothetical protein
MRKFIQDIAASLSRGVATKAEIKNRAAKVTEGSTSAPRTERETVGAVFASGRSPATAKDSPFWEHGEDWSDAELCGDVVLASGLRARRKVNGKPKLVYSEGRRI